MQKKAAIKKQVATPNLNCYINNNPIPLTNIMLPINKAKIDF